MSEPAPNAPAPERPRSFEPGAVAALFAAALVAYRPALQGGFIWNDADYLTKPGLRSLAGLGRIWCQVGATEQYYPLLHSAFWLEHHLWGDAPLGYHLVNVLLHAASAWLLARVLRQVGGFAPASLWPWFAAFLFALHPVCVESVAWVAEEKNTLSTVFYLAAGLVYLRWRAAPARPGRYAAASALFLCALLSKSVTATLPAALLVVLWWRQGRLAWRRDVVPLLPWFAAGAAAGLFTGWVERTYVGAHGADFALGPAGRCVVAGRALWFYLGKLLWPAPLIFIYPRWQIRPSDPAQWLPAAAALAAGAGLAVLAFGRGRRGPLAAALYFGGSLFPILGFFNIFAFIFSYVADHFQYVASLGVFAAAAFGAAALEARFRPKPAVSRGAAAALLLVLGVLTFRQARMYGDVVTFYRTTIARNPDSWMSHLNLGARLVETGQGPEGIAEIETGLRLKPGNALAEYDLATAWMKGAQPANAAEHYRRAIALEPGYVKAHYGLGLALARLNRPGEALTEYEEAVRLAPDFLDARASLGEALLTAGRFAEAAADFGAILSEDPDNAQAHLNLGLAQAEQNHLEAAAAQFAAAARLQPGDPNTEVDLAQALAGLGRLPEAAEHIRAALRIDPNFAPARELLANLAAAASAPPPR